MARRPFRITALALGLAALLSACGVQGAAQTPASTPAAPTAPPAPSETPTTAPAATATSLPVLAPTALPAGASVLPRALYILKAGQIFRIETDGATRTQITYEVPFRNDVLAVTDVAVSPADGSLAYTVQREGAPVLVRSGPNGEDAAPFFDNAAVGVSDPLFTPDGAFVAARLAALPSAQPASFQSGLYLLPLDGSEPQLLVADEPGSTPETVAFGHGPAAFAPDGTRLLTYRFGLNLDVCDLGVVSVPDGTAIALQAPPASEQERVTSCGPAAWAVDGSGIYYSTIRIGAPGSTAIWRADPTTGASAPITPQPEGPPFTLYEAPALMEDGTLRAFMAQADALPMPFAETPAQLPFAMAEIGLADGLLRELRAPMQERLMQALWDTGGRGAVAMLLPETGDARLVWLPVGAGEPVLLLDDATDLTSYAWAAS